MTDSPEVAAIRERLNQPWEIRAAFGSRDRITLLAALDARDKEIERLEITVADQGNSLRQLRKPSEADKLIERAAALIREDYRYKVLFDQDAHIAELEAQLARYQSFMHGEPAA